MRGARRSRYALRSRAGLRRTHVTQTRVTQAHVIAGLLGGTLCAVLTGFWTKRNEQSDLVRTVQRMTDAITYRGPDDQGTWTEQGCGVAFGHRRLSIIDLSPEGHQPMHSASGRFVLVYNGEIYNFEDMRADLERETGRRAWRGHSDTEVILEAIEHWGVEEAVGRFVGMFALALWDRAENALYLVRDRLGIKPLYYGWSGPSFLFGSELHTLKRHPDFEGCLNQRAIGAYLRYRYVPSPESIYKDIYKLPPGSILKLQHPLERAEPRAYWSAYEVAQAGVRCPFEGSAEEAVDALHDLLADAVKRRMVADVPLGAFLSGGIDSSTVVALMQAQSTQRVKTFTVGFNEKSHNEAHHAKAVAEHLGTDHTELYVTPEDALAVIPDLPRLYDEPFADESQIPTFLISELARRKVTVSLSGDGGDELFGGYTTYQKNQGRWQALERVPYALRSPAARMLGKTAELPQQRLDALGKLLPSRLQGYTNADQIGRVAEYLNLRSQRELHKKNLTQLDAHRALLAAQADEAYIAERPELDLISRLRAEHDVLGYDDLYARRYPRQARPGEHEGEPGSAGAYSGSPSGRTRVALSARAEFRGRRGQAASAQSAPPLRA